jgi:predicted ATP-grasp superfamily ATP-dependent carboligase
MSDPNPSRAEPDWPPALVAGAYQTGVVLMRNLARRGVKVSCIDCDSNRPAFHTVYGKAYLCPNPDEEPAAWVDFMVRLGAQFHRRPVLISSSDRYVSAVADHVPALKERFIFAGASAVVQGLLATKRRQYELADRHGLPTPRTQVVGSTAELKEFAAAARFPCLLKPIHFRDWHRFPKGHPLAFEKIAVGASPAELERVYEMAAQANPQAVVQEIIEGPDTAKLVYLSCYAQDRRRLGSCMFREVRTDPIFFGSASVVEPVSDPATDAICDRFLRSIDYAGLCEIELKRDSRDGSVKIIEANPRYSVTSDAAPYAGVDLGWLHYLDLIGHPVRPVLPEAREFRHIVLYRDANTFRSYLRAGLLTWREFFASYCGRVFFFDLDLRDWSVTARNLWAVFKLLIRPYLRRA